MNSPKENNDIQKPRRSSSVISQRSKYLGMLMAALSFAGCADKNQHADTGSYQTAHNPNVKILTTETKANGAADVIINQLRREVDMEDCARDALYALDVYISQLNESSANTQYTREYFGVTPDIVTKWTQYSLNR